MILRHERFERNHRLGARIKRMFSLHGSAHPYERLGGESDANPQRHQAGLPNQDDNTAAMIAIQIETRPTFSTRPHEYLRPATRVATIAQSDASVVPLVRANLVPTTITMG